MASERDPPAARDACATARGRRALLPCAALAAGLAGCAIDGREFETPVAAFARGLHFPSNVLTVEGPLPHGSDAGVRLLAPTAPALVVAPGDRVPFVVRWEGGSVRGVNLHCHQNHHRAAILAPGEAGPARVEIVARLDDDVCANLPARCHLIQYGEQLVASDGRYGLPQVRALQLNCGSAGDCAASSETPDPDDRPRDAGTGDAGSGSSEVDPGAAPPLDGVIGESEGGARPSECSPNESRCEPGSARGRQVCVDDNWIAVSSCEFACRDELSTTGLRAGECFGDCIPDTKRCSGSDVLQTCRDDHTYASANCPFVCSAGSCTGECEPNTFRCANGVRERCDANGFWQPQPCPAGSVCAGVVGMCTTPI